MFIAFGASVDKSGSVSTVSCRNNFGLVSMRISLGWIGKKSLNCLQDSYEIMYLYVSV